MVKLYFKKKIKGQKMHQTKKIKNNRSNVMAWSIELVIRVMDLTEFNMFSHKSIVNLNILKNTKKKLQRGQQCGPMPVKGKTKACRPLSLSPHAWACYFCSRLKGLITFLFAILEFGHHSGVQKMRSVTPGHRGDRLKK